MLSYASASWVSSPVDWPAHHPRAILRQQVIAELQARHTIRAASSTPPVQGDWPIFHGDLQRDGAATLGGGSMLTPAWSYCSGAAILASPIVSAGVVYIASTNGILAALNTRSGAMLWQFRAGWALYSSPAIQNGIVYIGALDGFVYAVDAVSGHHPSSRADWSSLVPPQR